MSLQVLATMSPTASEQFGKIASVAVIMTLLPYIYSAIALKVLGYKKMPHRQYTVYTVIILFAAAYSLLALIGSDGEQTRWSLIFVIATIVFYALALNRQHDIEEARKTPGGVSPHWVRYLTLTVTLVALALMFWLSVGRHDHLQLRGREAVVEPPAHSVDSLPATDSTQGETSLE